jgi:DNA-binding NarL/FixJ family response regulator
MDGLVETNGAQDPLERLTPREYEVLRMVSHGRTNAQVAHELGVTVHAVKFHVASILRKTGSKNRTEAAVSFSHLGRSRGEQPEFGA